MLYFVATPIGNLKDISLRAIDTLKSVDVIACEDTRHSKILLDNYEIKTKTIAYHKFNETTSADGIIELLRAGKNVAVISDAGMPVISDPGNILAVKLHKEGIPYTVIPGANAGLSALILSGMNAEKFAFFGFLSEKNKERQATLEEMSKFCGTRILYSSKYNINKDLASLFFALGECRVAIVGEITKIYENVEIVTLPFTLNNPKGEYVLIVEHAQTKPVIPDDKTILTELNELMKSNDKNKSFKQLQTKYQITKSYIYNLYEKNKGNVS